MPEKSSIFKEATQERDKSWAPTLEQWWMPSDPVSERRLVAVLVEMARCVLAGERGNARPLEGQELPSLPDAGALEGDASVSRVRHQADGCGEP